MGCAAAQGKKCRVPVLFLSTSPVLSSLSSWEIEKSKMGSFRTRACFHFMFNFLTPKPPGFPTLLLQPLQRRADTKRWTYSLAPLLSSF